MSSFQKKIIFLFIMVLIAFAANIVPRNGKVVTAGDNLSPENKQLSLSSLESQAAVVSGNEVLDNEMKLGPEENDQSDLDLALKNGAFIPSPVSSEPPFKQKADLAAPGLGASIALIADLESGTSYLEKGMNRHWPIASITKLMTALVAERAFTPDALVMITAEDVPEDKTAVSQYLKPGEMYRANDLIQVMLIASDNVAANALARAYGSEAFMKAMNEEARVLGMTHTYYYDPSGLSPISQSSLGDLEKLAFELVNHDSMVFSTTRKAGVKVTEQSSKTQRKILPINIFAGRSDFLGGKTGFIDEAGGNLLSIFSIKKRPVLFIVFNSPGRFEDTNTLLSWFKANYE